MDKNLKVSIRSFVDSYIDDEYSVWEKVHTLSDDREVNKFIEEFEAKYMSDGVFSDISRPGGMDKNERKDFAGLLSTKQKRKIYCIKYEDDAAFVMLGSTLKGNDLRYEMLGISERDHEIKIVASYHNNFDGTFSYTNGKYFGELLDDPCPESDL